MSPTSARTTRVPSISPIDFSRVETVESVTGGNAERRNFIAFVIGLGANLLVVLTLRNNFPFEDSVNHLTRWVLMARAWTGHGAPYVRLHAIPSPYLGLDLVGAALATFLSPAMTLRVMAVLVVTSIPVGFYLLLRSVGRENTGWSLVGVLIGFGFFAHVGFMNYTIGLGLSLAWLAGWWPARAEIAPVRLGALSLGIIVLYLFHLSAPLIVLVVIWLDMLLHWRTPRWRGVMVITGTLALFIFLQLAMTKMGGNGHGVTYFGTPWSKIRNIFTPFYVYGYGQAVVAIATYALGLGLYFRTNSRPRFISTWGLSIAAFFALYFIFPANLPGAGYLDMRWLLPAFLFPFCLAEGNGRRVHTGIVVALLIGSLINTALLARSVRTIDRELDDYAAALNRLPDGQTIFPIVADEMRWGPRVLPYRHFAFWYQIERGGRVPSLFNYGGDGNKAPNLSFMPYFEETTHLYPPPPGWNGGQAQHIEPLDWSKIVSEYDYVIVAGPDPRVRQDVSAHTQEAFTVGEITVYSVPGRSTKSSAVQPITPPSPAT
jgi:hypothetical protein